MTRHVEDGSTDAAIAILRDEMHKGWHACGDKQASSIPGDCIKSEPMHPRRAQFLSNALNRRSIIHALGEDATITMDVDAARTLEHVIKQEHRAVSYEKRTTLGSMADTFVDVEASVEAALEKGRGR